MSLLLCDRLVANNVLKYVPYFPYPYGVSQCFLPFSTYAVLVERAAAYMKIQL